MSHEARSDDVLGGASATTSRSQLRAYFAYLL